MVVTLLCCSPSLLLGRQCDLVRLPRLNTQHGALQGGGGVCVTECEHLCAACVSMYVCFNILCVCKACLECRAWELQACISARKKKLECFVCAQPPPNLHPISYPNPLLWELDCMSQKWWCFGPDNLFHLTV